MANDEEQIGPEQNNRQRTSPVDRINSGVDTARKIRAGVQKARQAIKYTQRARKAIQVARVVTTAASNPEVSVPAAVIIIIIIIFLIVFITLMGGFSSENDNSQYPGAAPTPAPVPGGGTPPLAEIPGLEKLDKSAGAAVNNGEDIIYTITAIYSGTDDVTVIDQIPKDTEYRDASGTKTVDNANSQVLWHLRDNTPSHTNEAQGEDVYTFTLKVHPLKDDITVVNQAFATAPGGATSGPAPATTDFSKLMEGQGRNTNALGDENSFVTSVLNNIQYRFPSGVDYQPFLQKIYQKSIGYNINPAIILTIWGVETTFAREPFYVGTQLVVPFGCFDGTSSFDDQLECSARTLNSLMNEFEAKKQAQGGRLPVDYNLGNEGQCPFWDPFLYAYEAYTPVCSMNDSNDEARGNFVIIYKDILYGKQ
jgi:hypothetical protein